MESHAPPGGSSDQSVKGAIAFIEKLGAEFSKKFLEALEAIQPTTIKLRSLQAKGQVFKFEGYSKCQHAITRLTWQFDRL